MRHRLGQGIRESLPARRQTEELGVDVFPRDIDRGSGEFDPPFDIELADDVAERPPILALADDPERPVRKVGGQRAEGPDQGREVLLVGEAPDREQRLGVGPAQHVGHRSRREHRIGNDDDSTGQIGGIIAPVGVHLHDEPRGEPEGLKHQRAVAPGSEIVETGRGVALGRDHGR